MDNRTSDMRLHPEYVSDSPAQQEKRTQTTLGRGGGELDL